MQPRPPVVFRQRRDFGQTISDTFAFFRQHWKPLLKANLLICVVPIIIGLAFVGAFMFGMFSRLFGGVGGFTVMPVLPGMGAVIGFLLAIPCFLFAGVMMEALTHEYLRAYQDGEHVGMTTGQLWRRAISHFWSYFGLLFLNGLATVVGLVLCYLPGIWIGTSFVMGPMAFAAERKGATEALGRSFKLANKKWWWTFLLVVVLYLIMSAIQMIVFLPFYFIALFSMLAGLSGDGSFSDGLPITAMVVGGIGYLLLIIVSFLLVPMFRVGTALWYYNLVEETESQGLQDRLGSLEAQ